VALSSPSSLGHAVRSMQESSFPRAPNLVVPFDHAGRAGTVRVYYGVTRHPAASGFGVLPGWGEIDAAGVGFPTIKGVVESDRPGYGSWLAWVQWVTQDFRGNRPSVRLVDRAPSLLDRDIPFLSWGYAPSLFDAPAFNSLPEVVWRATAFLCTMPILSRREPVVPLVGVRWGYDIPEAGHAPEPRPLELAEAPDWRAARTGLRTKHPRWRFAARFESGRSRR
jgi:hypothetical protein